MDQEHCKDLCSLYFDTFELEDIHSLMHIQQYFQQLIKIIKITKSILKIINKKLLTYFLALT